MKKLLLAASAIALLGLSACGEGTYHDNASARGIPMNVVQNDGEFQIRSIAPYTVAEVTATGTRIAAVTAAGNVLNDYVNGKNEANAELPMSTPVTQRLANRTTDYQKLVVSPVVRERGSREKSDAWVVQFPLPTANVASLPLPLDNRVRLTQTAARQVIALSFNGPMDDTNFRAAHESLKAYADSRNLNVVGNPMFAYYDDLGAEPGTGRYDVFYQLANN